MHLLSRVVAFLVILLHKITQIQAVYKLEPIASLHKKSYQPLLID